MSRSTDQRGIRTRQMLGFAVAGAVGFLVDAGVLTLGASLLGLPPALARVPSFLAAAVTTWAINRRLTFRSSRPPSLAEFLHYLSAMLLGLAINFAVFLIVLWLSDSAAAFPVLALVPATLCGMAANFLTSRMILDR